MPNLPSLFPTGMIEGIPGVPAWDNSNIHTLIVPSSETSITLELTCKCSLYVPQWHTQPLEEESGQFFVHPIQCINGTRPCSLNYIPESEKSQGLFVYLTNNFTLTESTALMCFSNIDRDALIVYFSNGKDQSTTNAGTDRKSKQMYMYLLHAVKCPGA